MNGFNVMWGIVFIYVGLSGYIAFLLKQPSSIFLSLCIFIVLDNIWVRPYVYKKCRKEQKSEGDGQ